jgi:hypothetical protein
MTNERQKILKQSEIERLRSEGEDLVKLID